MTERGCCGKISRETERERGRKNVGKEKKDEPVASTSKATPPDSKIKSGAPQWKKDPPMKLTIQEKILKEQKSTDLCCSKHFFAK